MPHSDTAKVMEENMDRFDRLKKERRYVIVPIDINLFGEMLMHGSYQYRAEGLPSDAIFVSADKGMGTNCFYFWYLHESFEPVREGQVANQLNVTLTRVNVS